MENKKIREDGLTNLIEFVKFMRNESYVKKKDIEKLGYGSNKTIWRYMQKLKTHGIEFISDIGRFGKGLKIIEDNRLTLEELEQVKYILKLNESGFDNVDKIIEKIKIMNDKVF